MTVGLLGDKEMYILMFALITLMCVCITPGFKGNWHHHNLPIVARGCVQMYLATCPWVLQSGVFGMVEGDRSLFTDCCNGSFLGRQQILDDFLGC